MNALQPHRPRSLRLASFELLMCRLTASNGDYTQLISCLTDSDPVIQEKVSHALPEIHIFIDDSVKGRIRDQLLVIIKQNKQPMTLFYAAQQLGDNKAIRSELYAWLEDDDPVLRLLSCWVLQGEDESGAHIPVLINLFEDAPEGVSPITGYSLRNDAVSLLSYNRLDSPGVLSELVKAIDHPN